MNPDLEKAMKAYRAQGATDEQVTALYNAWMQAHGGDATTPPENTDINLRNLGRSAAQGATLGFADKFNLIDRDAQKAFQEKHPVADFLAKLGGGAIAPIAAVAAAPEALAGVGGAALLGGGSGAITAANDATGGIGDRAASALVGAGVGTVGGIAGYGAGKALGAAAGGVASRLFPEAAAERSVGKATQGLLSPADASAVTTKMNDVNALAPGGSSPATAAIAPDTRASRFTTMVRGVGASPEAAAGAEAKLTSQQQALSDGMKNLGTKMDALSGDIPLTPKARTALMKVQSVLGGKAPDVPAPVTVPGATVPGFAPTSLATPITPTTPTIAMQDAREALSRLRYLARQADKRGIEANGVTVHDIAEAKNALQDVIYTQKPDFKILDRQYASLANEMRAANKLVKTVQLSRQNYAGNEAYGATAGSLGGSLPKGAHGVVMSILDKILTNKSAAADAVNRMVVTPGASIQGLLDAAPGTARVAPAVRAGLMTSLTPALAGLLYPTDQRP